MMREVHHFVPRNSEWFKYQITAFTQSIEIGIVLNSNKDLYKNNLYNYSTYHFLAGINTSPSSFYAYNDLSQLSYKSPDWFFGFITYDVKNRFEKLYSSNFDGIDMPELCFFKPEYVIIEDNSGWRVEFNKSNNSVEDVIELIVKIENTNLNSRDALLTAKNLDVKSRITKDDYIETINKIKRHIHVGDIYEMNYCIEFYSNPCEINPTGLYYLLNSASPTPFNAYIKFQDKYLICASPERYIKKEGLKLISQPIKGTSPRNKVKSVDENAKKQLIVNPKERAENIMITDLVRNDLSRIATKGSVKVEELCGVYSFKQVHQMISTITATITDEVSFTDIIRSTFPMGSMTGAPKIEAMKLIEQYESTKRGLYSGTVGYISPNGDFDFNVVIRSILYNKTNRYLSFMVGSAITDQSDPELEYKECLLKASAILKVLNSNKDEH